MSTTTAKLGGFRDESRSLNYVRITPDSSHLTLSCLTGGRQGAYAGRREQLVFLGNREQPVTPLHI